MGARPSSSRKAGFVTNVTPFSVSPPYVVTWIRQVQAIRGPRNSY